MNELLTNEKVIAALVALLVCLFNRLHEAIKKKYPTAAESVESNWCYIGPVVEVVMGKAKEWAENKGVVSVPDSFGNKNTTLWNIVYDGVEAFKKQYVKLEGHEPSSFEAEAARDEIRAAVERASGGRVN